MKTVSSEHCNQLDVDLQEFRRLKQSYPGRLKAIRYEDGAMDPLEYTAGIYTFLGLEVTDDVRRYVTDITSASKERFRDTNQPYSVKRSDPVQTMQSWRYNTTFEHASAVDSQCSHLYTALGYRVVQSQEDLLSNRTLITQMDTDL